MSQYLASQIGGYLPPFGHYEGQMVPEVKPMMRNKPWANDTKFDWEFIRKEWSKRAQGKVFVEASPPNIVRPDEIAQVFGEDSTGLVSVCNPLQFISSSMRRYNQPGANVKRIARNWVKKANLVRDIRQRYPHFPFISYEAFVQNPTSINEAIHLEPRDVQIEGKKGSNLNGIVSGYTRAIGFLKLPQIEIINSVLAEHQDLLGYFDYRLESAVDIMKNAKETNPLEFSKGFQNRKAWMAKHRKDQVLSATQ